MFVGTNAWTDLHSHKLMSAKWRIAALSWTYGDFRVVPLAESSFFDDVVGDGEQSIRNGETERLGSLEIDDEIEFGWLLDR